MRAVSNFSSNCQNQTITWLFEGQNEVKYEVSCSRLWNAFCPPNIFLVCEVANCAFECGMIFPLSWRYSRISFCGPKPAEKLEIRCVLWWKKRMSRHFLGVILCAASSVRGWVQRWELHWCHLVDEKWMTNKETHKKSSRPLCRISNHPPFNTKSRYNIYIHGLKGKNRYACEEGWRHQSRPSTHFL